MPTPEPNLHLTRAIHGAVISLEERAREYSLEQVLRATLDEAETLTGSCIGFYHFVAEDQENLHLQAWSTRTEAEFCRAEGKGLHYPISKAGVWADCLRTGHPLMHNDYPNLPNRQGLPPGHAAVLRELVVPVKRGGRVVAVLGVGNKATDYDAVDVETVQLLADLAWHLAAAKRMTRALEESLAKNQALVRAIPDLIFTNRRDGEYLDAHVSDPELLLVPPEAFLHRNVREVLPKALADQFVRAFEEALDSGMEQKLTYALQLEDAEKQFEGRVVPYSTDSVITIVRDITEETRAARALLQEKERLSRIFQASYDAIYVTDLHDGTYLNIAS
jgi:PAS domain-containing protein